MACKRTRIASLQRQRTLAVVSVILLLSACVNKTELTEQDYNPPNCDSVSVEGFKCEDGKIAKIDNEHDHIEYHEQLRPLHERSDIIEQEIKDLRDK